METLRTLLCLAVLLCALPANAQEKDRIVSGQIRLRSELDGRGILNDQTVLVHLMRSRIRATIKPLQGISILAEVQDSRWWGQSDASLGRGTVDASAEALDMHQAWAQIDSVFGAPINLRVGRQELSFASERLIGAANWANTGRSFDAARATYVGDRLNVDLFASRLSAPTAGPIASQNLYGLFVASKTTPEFAFDIFGLRDDNMSEVRSGIDSGLAVLERVTAGTVARLNAAPFDAELEGAIQLGSSAANDSSARKSINAFMASASLGFMFLPESKSRVYLLGTVLSGDGGAADDKSENFNTLFGTNHKFFGLMDYVPDVTGSLGLVDLSAGITTTPVKNLRIVLEGHSLKPQRGTDSSYGTEVDLTFFWRTSPAFEFSGGGGVFMTGPELEARLNGDKARYWVYLSGQFDL